MIHVLVEVERNIKTAVEKISNSKGYIITSNIVDIHEIDDVIYVETQNSVQNVDNKRMKDFLKNKI
jgi:hypothetical protein